MALFPALPKRCLFLQVERLCLVFAVGAIVVDAISLPSNSSKATSPSASSGETFTGDSETRGSGGTGNCQNPLFQTHWAGKSDIRHLNAYPQVQLNLQLCPAFNGRRACCSLEFEEVMGRVFDRWVTHWRRKAQRIRGFQMEMTKVKVSTAYVRMPKEERKLFDKALWSFRPVLELYGTCFDALLEYMAGMICFACDPHWLPKVSLDGRGMHVAHLHVHDSSNLALWESCMGIGLAGAEMRTRVADSKLAKTIWAPFEDLGSFSTKISVSEYMTHFGLFPLRGPNQIILVIGGPGSSDFTGKSPGASSDTSAPQSSGPPPSRSLSAAQQQGMTTAAPTEMAYDYLYPLRDGRISGFRCSIFPRRPLGLLGLSAGRRKATLSGIVVLLAALL